MDKTNVKEDLENQGICITNVVTDIKLKKFYLRILNDIRKEVLE